jgi:septal ring factor EnvC (AmiA/AmiB activator)
VLLGLNTRIKDKDANLRRLEKDRQELEALLDAVEETIADLKIPNDYRPFAARKGDMSWPTNGPVRYRFGSRQKPSMIRRQGVTIAGKSGNNVNAIHHGRVVFADWFRGKGLLIIVDHGDGFMSLYAHNQSLLSEIGDWIKAGEPIATVGNSGGQRESGLYFEIRQNGEPTNPARWCQSRKNLANKG